jgi:hypothetical protein
MLIRVSWNEKDRTFKLKDNENLFVIKVCSKNKRRTAHKQGCGD